MALFPNARPLPCASFAEALAAVREGAAARAVIAIENRVAGRVADVHTLLPESALHIVGEYYHPIEHHLLGVDGATLETIGEVLSHEQALAQCRGWLHTHAMHPTVHYDTAGAAAEVARRGNPTVGAIASKRAGDLYGLVSLAKNIADTPKNMTRFLVLARDSVVPPAEEHVVTTLIFSLRSIPAALYKALGGFATNGINLTKIESYISPNDFTSARFYVDVEGHPALPNMQHALDELRFFTEDVQILGTYARAPRRDD